jgi:hypothetical protein
MALLLPGHSGGFCAANDEYFGHRDIVGCRSAIKFGIFNLPIYDSGRKVCFADFQEGFKLKPRMII